MRPDKSPRAASSQASLEDELANIRDLVIPDPAAALSSAESILRTNADPRVFRVAAEACRRLGLQDDAISAELAAIQAALSSGELAAAAAAQSENRSSDALTIVQSLLDRQPDDLLALTIAAEAEIRIHERLRGGATSAGTAPGWRLSIGDMALNRWVTPVAPATKAVRISS